MGFAQDRVGLGLGSPGEQEHGNKMACCKQGPDGDGFEETHGWLLILRRGLGGSVVNREGKHDCLPSPKLHPLRYELPASCGPSVIDEALATVLLSQTFPTFVPIMHGPVLPLLIVGLGLAGVVLARVLLLPIAKAMQARQGYSDQFVTDLTLALPLSAFILGALAGLIWLVR
jgi:hypothetical protein